MTVRTFLGPALSLLCLMTAPRVTEAGVAPLRPQLQVNTTTYGSQGFFHGPDVAASAAGDFMVVWEDRYAYPAGVFAQRFDSLGRRLGPEIPVHGSYAHSPAVAADPAGNFIVVWEDGYIGIGARRYQGGVAQGPAFQVNANTTAYPTNPKVAVDGAGTFTVVWHDGSPAAPYYSAIAFRRFDSTGTPLGVDFQVAASTSTDLGFNDVDEDPDGIEVAADPAGGFMVVWEEYGADGSTDAIRGRVFDSTGAPLGGALQVNTLTADFQDHPGIAADGAGRFIVGWKSDALGYPGSAVAIRRFSTTGVPLGGEFQASTSPISHYGPKIAAGPAGGFVVVWEVDNYEVRGREFDSTAAPVGPEFQVHDTELYYQSDKRTPAIAGGASGSFVVVWNDYYFDGDGWAIAARRLGAASTPCAPAAMTGCRQPTIPGRGLLRYKENISNPARSTLLWRWVRGQAASVGDFGDPFTTDSYAFCLYDASGAGGLVLAAVAPAGGACGTLLCWRTLSGSRVDYFDRARFADGLEGIRLTPGADGAARALVKATGTRLALPTSTLIPPVTAQLQGPNGECWSAEYTARITENIAGRFRGVPGP